MKRTACLLLLCSLLLTGCRNGARIWDPVPPQPAFAPAAPKAPVNTYLPAALGQSISLPFVTMTPERVGHAAVLRQGYAAIRPAGEGEAFFYLRLRLENPGSQSLYLRTTSLVSRITIDDTHTCQGSLCSFSGSSIPPGGSRTVYLWAALDEEVLQNADAVCVRFAFEDGFSSGSYADMGGMAHLYELRCRI